MASNMAAVITITGCTHNIHNSKDLYSFYLHNIFLKRQNDKEFNHC